MVEAHLILVNIICLGDALYPASLTFLHGSTHFDSVCYDSWRQYIASNDVLNKFILLLESFINYVRHP